MDYQIYGLSTFFDNKSIIELMSNFIKFSLTIICVSLSLAACSDVNASNPTNTITAPITATSIEKTKKPTPSKTAVTIPVTETLIDKFAAVVNGEGILLSDYESELIRFRETSGTGLATYGEERVLDDMIDQVLLAQAAYEDGFIVDEALIQERIQKLGLSTQALSEWKTDHGYTDESFHRAMTLAIASAWMRDTIIAGVPNEAEQVHARQILLYNSSEAEAVLAQLEAGIDFGVLADEYDPVTKGDLGWFPRGYLTVTELDDNLFSLEPGAFSGIIQSPLGYHIVQVIEHDPIHPLTANTHRVVKLQAIAEWLENQRNLGEIVILVH